MFASSALRSSLFLRGSVTSSMARRGLASDAAATIPINGTTRMVRLRVKDEADAIKAQEILVKAHNILKKDGKGYVGSTRFLCKSQYDMMVFFRFADLDSLKAYMGSDVHAKKFTPLADQLNALDVNGKAHQQNFIADDW